VPEKSLCPECNTRPPRRSCPALREDICAVCCGTEREETVNCPFDCEFLREARRHEKAPEPDPKTLPHAEIEVSDRFMSEQQPLAMVTGRLLLASALEAEGAVDSDVREALDALVRTYKTAESGLVYETRPSNLIAAAIQQRFQQEVAKFREDVAQRTGAHTVRDKDLLGVLVFWQRTEWQRNNGRRKGRAFIETLFALVPVEALQQEEGA
jgi:hypothetical protein